MAMPKEPTSLECPVCNDIFTLPKILPCGHLVCRDCLLSWLLSCEEGGCPLCRCPIRDVTAGPGSDRSVQETVEELPTDLAMAALVQDERLVSRPPDCCLCEGPAQAVCRDCGDAFCSSCRVLHTRQSLTRLHKLQDLDLLTSDPASKSGGPALCPEHPLERVKAYCPSHQQGVCLLCAATSHRLCPQVVSLQTRMQETVANFNQLITSLADAEAVVDLNVGKVVQHVRDEQKRSVDAVADIRALCHRLQSAVKETCSVMTGSVQQAASDVIQGANDVREILTQRRAKLSTHKTVLEQNKRHQERTSLCEVCPKLKSRVTDLCDSLSPPRSKTAVKSFAFTIDNDTVSKIEKEIAKLGNVTFTTLFSLISLGTETPEFEFHPRHGLKLKLSNNNKTAERTSRDVWDGTVVSRDPMQTEMLYEVQVEEVNAARTWTVVGATTASPDTANQRRYFWRPYPGMLCLSSGGDLYAFGHRKKDDRLKALDTLTTGSRVGLALDRDLDLHLYLQGVDKGVVAPAVPQPTFFVFDLVARCTKITAQPVKRIKLYRDK